MDVQPWATGPQERTRVGPASPDERRQQAIKRIRARNAFKTHLVVYLTVNTVLVVFWVVAAIGGWTHTYWAPHQQAPVWFPWPIFVILGWGIGLVSHFNQAYRGSQFTEGQIQREMNRLP